MAARTFLRADRTRRAARVRRSAYTHCLACGRPAYTCRRDARRAARITHPGARPRAYRCREPDGQGWHHGPRPTPTP